MLFHEFPTESDRRQYTIGSETTERKHRKTAGGMRGSSAMHKRRGAHGSVSATGTLLRLRHSQSHETSRNAVSDIVGKVKTREQR